ncbi:hypothetical protein MCOR02_012499 [Pyricularia oryzae]|uniref:RRM domain-containing protein n=3 Tax=Pyricularia TaxID=48558 RepID=A0ABQ8NZB4_PYRGI|nr:hypothetical protein MCOR02_012499 [Pyricularia oryzae]KAI6304287.1 hypothetical protein MCOR33_000598 [Pyricularia grisea]KAI6280909.1 hypothetical protein MCOR26_003484 [Pyricularia oryzae]KAI6324022.1 hypothetical protein MCOR34_001589 [Pyricularia oryzae]KAI6344952.1 hypothetical protein MCOR28_003840 [Pyricularia oryzae]
MGKRKTEESNGVEVTSKKRRRDEAEVDNVEIADAAKAEKKRLKKDKKDKKKTEVAVNNEEGADDEEQQKKDKKQKKEKKAKKTEEEEEEQVAPVADVAESEKKEKKDKKDKKSKKYSKAKSEDGATDGQGDEEKPKTKRKREAEETSAVADAPAAVDEKSEKKKKKKKSKDGKRSEKSSEESAGDKNGIAAGTTTSNCDGAADAGTQEGDDEEQQAAGKNARFIVFVGNLPFTATKQHIEAHFASLKPTSVRLLTDRNDPKKSRGIAFVEFDNYSHMKTCLAKMHHSEFEDGVSAPRKINVELTAGGGGKTPYRNEKIRAKNDKLREERARRMKAELEAKHKEDEQDGIHPSRRAQMHRSQHADAQ